MAIEDGPSSELAEVVDAAQEKVTAYDPVTEANLAASSTSELPVVLDDEVDVEDAVESIVVPPVVEMTKEVVAAPTVQPIARRAVALADTNAVASASAESADTEEALSPGPNVQDTPAVPKPVEDVTTTTSTEAKTETMAAPVKKPVVSERPTLQSVPEDEGSEEDEQFYSELSLLDELDDRDEDELKKLEWLEEFEKVPEALREEFTAKAPPSEATKTLPEKADSAADSEPEEPTVDEPPEEVRPLSNSEAVKDETNDDYYFDLANRIEFTEKPETIARVQAVAEGLEPPFRSPATLACMYQLAKQLRPHFTEFDTLVVDDISGRVPGLVYRKLINDARAEEGLPPAETYFVNGRYELLADNPLSRGFTAPEGRILILTEYASSGFAALNLYEAILSNQPEAQVDLAALGAFRPLGVIRTRLKMDSNLYVGDNGPAMGRLLHHTRSEVRYKGVFKRPNDAVSRREPGDIYNGKIVARAREEAKYVAGAFAKILVETAEDEA